MINRTAIHKIAAFMILIVVCGSLSCSQDEYIFIPDNESLSFTDNTESYILNGKAVEVPIYRGVADMALSVDINLDEGSIYTLQNKQVQFAKGEYIAKVSLSYLQTGLMPGTVYKFRIYFSEDLVSASGTNVYEGEGTLPLDLLEYGNYGTVLFIGPTYSSKYPSDVVDHMTVEERTYTIQVAKYTTTYYRINNFFSSDTHFDFVLTNEGNIKILAPPASYDCPVYGSATYKFASSATYNGHKITVWFDADPDCITPYDYGEMGYSVVEGTCIDFDAIFTIGNDYIPRPGSTQKWHAYETFKVTSINKN